MRARELTAWGLDRACCVRKGKRITRPEHGLIARYVNNWVGKGGNLARVLGAWVFCRNNNI